MFVTRSVRIKYMNPAGEGGSDNGGTGTGGSGSGEGGGDGGQGGEGGDAAAVAAAAAAAAAAGGAKKPSDEEARLLKENMKKKGQVEDLTKKLTDAQSVLAQLESLGGLEQIAALVNEKKDSETKSLEAKGDYERLKTRMAEEHTTEVKKLKDQIAALQSQVGASAGQINELTVGTQFGQSEFITKQLTLPPAKARALYGDHFDLVEGKVVGYDKPRGAANRTAFVDQYGNSVAFDEAVKKIVDADPDREHLYRSTVKPGAGSETKKPTGSAQKLTDSMSKITSGLKGLNIV